MKMSVHCKNVNNANSDHGHFTSAFIVELEQVFAKWKASIKRPANIYLCKVNNRNTRKRGEICVFIVNFEHISHCFPVFLLLILNK